MGFWGARLEDMGRVIAMNGEAEMEIYCGKVMVHSGELAGREVLRSWLRPCPSWIDCAVDFFALSPLGKFPHYAVRCSCLSLWPGL